MASDPVPLRTLLLVSLAAAVLSAWPVVFLGRSFISPNSGAFLLYDQFPTLPGYRDSRTIDAKGSDVGAALWQAVPYAAIERRALGEGEWPVWNRYNSLGTPLLGQGQSMFGDPLQLLVWAAGGAAWAWDFKYLAAKVLLALGLGLCVYAITRHRGASLLVSLGAPSFGFFVYRANHPAFFSFCYAPWILFGWLLMTQAETCRGAAVATAALVASDWAELASGTVKEAATLLLCLNAAGALILLASKAAPRRRLAQAAFATAGTVLLCGMACPLWATFLTALRQAWTTSAARIVAQIQPSLLLGSFDEALYRPLSRGNLVFNPSSNFLFLGGLLYLAAAARTVGNRAVAALAVAAGAAAALAFGVVPAAWIAAVPFVGNLLHVDDCFSLVFILIGAVLAGAGFAAAARRLPTKDGPGDLWTAGVILGALVAGYIGFTQAAHRSVYGPDITFSLYPLGSSLPVSRFVWGYLATLVAALIALGLLARRALRVRHVGPAAAVGLAACAGALFWREALWPGATPWPNYVVTVGERPRFGARSPAVTLLQHLTARDPARVIGLQNNLFPGWTGVYGLEGVGGPDALINPAYRAFMDRTPLHPLWGWRYYLSRDNLRASHPFLDALNVRYYADLRSDQGALGAVLKLVRTGDLDLYESPTAWPRAFFTDRLERVRNLDGLMRRIADGDGRPFAALVGPEDGGAWTGLRERAAASNRSIVVPARDYRLTENATSFSIDAPRPGLAVLAEAEWPGYTRAALDGKPAPTRRVDALYTAVAVPAGVHRIAVWRSPPAFGRELLLAGLSAVVFAAGLVWAGRTRRVLPGAALP